MLALSGGQRTVPVPAAAASLAMHELSVAMSMIEGVEEEAERHCGRVTAIHVKVGALSGVVAEALQSAFEMAAEGTSVAGARLEIEEVPVVIYCESCQANQRLTAIEWFNCPVCDGPSLNIVEGRELEVTALELE